MKNLKGTLVTEEEAAHGLGFKDVFELRRWQTDLGKKIAAVEDKLRTACSDAQNFRYSGMRMQAVLNKIKPFLEHLRSKGYENVDDFLLAIDVVCGQGVDWNHKLKDWWTGIHEKSRYNDQTQEKN